MGPDTDDDTAITEELLRELGSYLADQSWVERVSPFPNTHPDSLVVELVSNHYPARQIPDVKLFVRAYANGDFNVIYREDHNGEEWMVRWDRHDSPVYSRDHFHGPPDARHADGEDRDYPRTLAATLKTVVVPFIQNRMGDVWDTFG